MASAKQSAAKANFLKMVAAKKGAKGKAPMKAGKAVKAKGKKGY